MGKKYSVSEITDLIKNTLESEFDSVSIEGEISNCKKYPSGHIYFTLKDSLAVISAVMFKGSTRTLEFVPQDGKSVLVNGRIQVYPPRGGYQIVVDYMEELNSTGAILEMLEKRKRRLAAEGLFDEERKKAIPRFPERIAVITSPQGAAIRDILQVLGRRTTALHVIVMSTPVQGGDAAAVIARRIEQANFWRLADVIIVGRGGGAVEDLLPFSEEVVVRAIAASDIPVVSAVGHEIDWALSDYAADLRAPTPSAAAELVAENNIETLSSIKYFISILEQSINMRLERTRLALKPFSAQNLCDRFKMILQPRLIRFDNAKEELVQAGRQRVEDLKQRVQLLKNTLENSNPLLALERGFSVVLNTRTGMVVRGADETQANDILDIQLARGSINARVV